MKLNHEYLDTIVNEVNLMIVVISTENTLVSANKEMLNFAKIELADIVDMPLWDLPWWQHDSDLQNKLLFAITDSYMGESSRFNATHKNHLGEEHEIDFIVKPIMKDGEPEYFIAMGYNISDLVSARKALTDRERRIKAFFDYSIEGYFFFSLPDKLDKKKLTDDNVKQVIEHFRIDSYNERLEEITGASINLVSDLFDSLGLVEDLHNTIKEMITNGSVTLKKTIVVDDETRHLQLILVSIYDDSGNFEGNFGIVRDITEQVNQLETITFFANKDYLTGINNRRNFFNEGDTLFYKNKELQEPLTLVMFDIDLFKKVNDTYGHDAGDIVIREIAEIVSNEIGESCVLGRYGGEEYIVLSPYEIDIVYAKFEKIRNKIRNNVFTYEGKHINVTVSMGLYAANYETDTLESCISKSDVALYESKSNGRNQSTIFIESVHGKSSLDELTGLYTETSMKYKLAKTIYDVKASSDTLWIIYFTLDVVKEDSLLTKGRHKKTMALCIKKSIRNSDYIGHIGENGYLVALRSISMKKAEDIHQRMMENFEIGFSGMFNNVIMMKSSIYNATMTINTDILMLEIEKQLDTLY